MLKAMKRKIRILKRKQKIRRQRRKANEILLSALVLAECSTLSELEFHSGYLAGITDKAAEIGEITKPQQTQILRILRYIAAGERKRLENE